MASKFRCTETEDIEGTKGTKKGAAIDCTHRLGAGQGDVPDLLADELQLGVVPLPLPLLCLQTRDQVRPEERWIKDFH